jgi:hypothetical protein
MSTKADVGARKRRSKFAKLPRMYGLPSVDKCPARRMGGWAAVEAGEDIRI